MPRVYQSAWITEDALSHNIILYYIIMCFVSCPRDYDLCGLGLPYIGRLY